MKYYIIYFLSAVILLGLFLVNPEHPPYPVSEESYMMLERAPSSVPDTSAVAMMYLPPPSEEKSVPEVVLDYLNELVTLIVGVINVITFYYQRKEKKGIRANREVNEEVNR